MSDNAIEIRITGAVDPSLVASVSQAKATLGTIGDQTTVTASAMSNALKAIAGDVDSLCSEFRALGVAAATADAGVASGLNTAEAATRGLGSAATASGAEVASGLNTAEDATHRLRLATAEAVQDFIRLGQQAAGGDFASMAGTLVKLASETGILDTALAAMRGKAGAVASGLNTAEAAARGLGGASTTAGGQVASGLSVAEGATRSLHFATAGAIQDYIRLGQAALSGDFSAMAGTMAELAGETGVLDAAIVTMGAEAAGIATGGVALLVAGLGYAIYQEVETERESQKLADSFALTGRSALDSAAGVRSQLEFLSSVSGASREAAQSFLGYVAAHASIDPVIANEVGQLLPSFVEMFGKQGPEAAGHLAETLSNLTEEGFKKLDSTLLHLSPEQYETIQNLIETGKTAEATSAIMTALSQHTGVYIKSLGDQAYDVEQKIKTLQDRFKGLSLARIAETNPEMKQLIASLVEIQRLRGEKTHQADDNAYKAELDWNHKVNQSLDQHQVIQDKIARAQRDEATALSHGRTGDAASFAKTAAAGQAELAALDKRANDESLRDFIAHEDAKVAASKRGSAERIQADQRELERARKLFGENSREYDDAQKKLGEEKRAAGEAGARADSKTVEDARHTAEELAQIHQNAALKHIEAEGKTNEFLLAMGQQTLEQFNAQAIKLENDRYKAELEGLNERRKAHEGDNAALAKDNAEGEALEQGHTDRLTAINERYDEKKKAAQEKAFQDFVKDEQAKLTAATAAYEAQFKAGVINEQQRHDLEVALTEAVEKEVLDRFDAENKGLKEGTDAYKKYIEARKALVAGFTHTITDDNNKLVDAEAEKWKQLASSIRSSFNSALDGLIFQGNTLKQFFANIAKSIAQSFLAMGEKIVEDWIEQELRALFVTQTTEVQKAAAVEAGGEAQVAFMQLTTAEGQAVSVAAGSKQIMNDAYKAAAGAFNSVMDAVPFPLNAVLAPIAAGVAFTAVAAYDTLTSAEGGHERVDSAEKLMVTHRDESVLPARISRPLMSFVGDLPAMAELVKQNSAPAFGLRASTPDPSSVVPGVVARAGSPDLRSIADVGSLLPVMSPSTSVRAAQRPQASQSDADYVASRVGGGGRASASPSPSKARGGDIHIHAWDASSMNQFFRKPANRRTMDQISKDRARAGFMPG